MVDVKLFSRKHCGLCQETFEDLKTVQRQIPFDLEIFDIDDRENLEWKKLYFEDIPVIYVNDKPFVKWGLDVEEFVKELKRLNGDGK